MINTDITLRQSWRGGQMSKYGRFSVVTAGLRQSATLFMPVVMLVAGLGWGGAASAQGIEPLDTIVAMTRNYLLQQNKHANGPSPQVTITPPDPRLRLANCGSGLEAFTPAGQNTVGDTVVGVRCKDANTPWTVYVQASVALIEPVLVASRPMSRGTVLNGDDVTLMKQDTARMTQGYLTDIKQVDGMVLRYSVRAGTVLRPALLQPPIVIKRGERVIIEASGGGVRVRMEGQALMNGAVGDIIRVRNLSSRRVVEGTVVSPGVVQVQF